MHHRFTTGMLYEEFNTDMKNYLTIVIYQHKQLIHIKLIFNCETLFFSSTVVIMVGSIKSNPGVKNIMWIRN